MIRRVAFKKAVLAGTLGAAAWDLAVRILLLFGLPLFDLVYTLGTMVFESKVAAWQWWTIGLLLHATVGSIWAIFYAYFFWSTFDWRPALQGLAFSPLPTLLAGFVMLPQMDYMHAVILAGELPRNGVFASGIGWGGAAAVVLGHVIYSLVMGAIYTKPVGYPVRRRVSYG